MIHSRPFGVVMAGNARKSIRPCRIGCRKWRSIKSAELPWLLCTRKDARKAGLRKSGQRTIRFEALLVGKTLLFKAPPDISFEIGSLALRWVYRQRIQDCRILTLCCTDRQADAVSVTSFVVRRGGHTPAGRVRACDLAREQRRPPQSRDAAPCVSATHCRSRA